MLEFPPLPHDLTWAIPAYLLVDGVSVPDLAHVLRQWNNSTYCLYQHTHWHQLSDISPYLVALEGVEDPLLSYFQENAAQEWGYLLFSHARPVEVCSHLRHLLAVEHPSGCEVMPRIADPAVVHHLLSASGPAQYARWLGPVELVCLPDALELTWQRHAQDCPDFCAAAQGVDIYRLTEQQLTALGEAEFRRAVFALNEHMQLTFPDYRATHTDHERLRHAREIAQKAYESGFTSEQEITFYANVLGYLGDESLTDHPDIAGLLTVTSSQTPLSRVKRAAELAEHYAAALQGRSL
jgi:hypothetical protein